MNELKIRKEKIDWTSIINLAFNRIDWGKNHVLYTYNDVTVTIVLNKFDFRDNTAMFYIECSYNSKSILKRKVDYVWYYMNNQSLDDFIKSVKRKVISILQRAISSDLEDEADDKYNHLHYSSHQMTDEIIKEKGYESDLNDIKNISNDSVAESAYETLVKEILEELNKPYVDKIFEYKRNTKTKLLNVLELKEDLENEMPKM